MEDNNVCPFMNICLGLTCLIENTITPWGQTFQ